MGFEISKEASLKVFRVQFLDFRLVLLLSS